MLNDLGDKVTIGLAKMVARTKADLALYRSVFPSWVSQSSDRGLLNWCHDRAWVHAQAIFDKDPGVSFDESPPIREMRVGDRYRMRVKKHDLDGGVSNVLTQGALDFMEQNQLTLPGFEGEIRLIAGYKWDPETRELGAAVITLRDGINKVVWMHELDEPADAAGGSSTTPILPSTPPVPPTISMAGDNGEHDLPAADQ